MCRETGKRKEMFVLKIAVTYEGGLIFQHFGHTSHFKIYEIEQDKVASSQVIDTNGHGHGALAGFLKEQGVNVERISINHVDVQLDMEYIYRLLDQGCYIEFDNFGKEYYIRREVRNSGYGCFVHDTDRVKFLKKMIDDGYIGQVLLSCDLCLKNLMHKYGGWGYDHVLTNIVPMMEDEGITADEIRTLLVENPANWLLGKE